MAKLSFAIAINLLTENFKKGTSQVKSALKSMQMQVLTFAAALGAGGIGLSGFVSQLINVARETSRVTTALKNVSGGMGQFADNQRFVIDMAKKYGLEVNALTGNFAKFTAASQVSGMSMQDQRKIFESVSRACTAFGMSADDSNGVFLALSQMMSKGKISSEELRLQMGERLPVALQAMAKAAGVSVGGLDKLMKQGKLMSKDVLPGFADALNEMIPNVDTNNLETSINRLKNAFGEFTNGMNIQSAYKGAIDWLTGAVESAGENIKNIVIGIVAVISGVIAKGAMKVWAVMGSTASQVEAAAIRSNTTLITATASRIAAEIALEEAKVAANNATGAAALAAKQRVIQAEKALIAASAVEQVEIENVKVAELKVVDAKILASAKTMAGALAAITRKRVAAEIELEAAKTGVITANSTQILAAQTRLAAAQKTLAKLTTQEVAAQEAAKVATIQAASVKSSGFWSAAYTKIRVGAAKLVVSLKAMWSAFAPMIIITAIMAIIGKFKAMYDEAKRIRNVFSDYKKESQISGYTQEVVTLKQQLKIMNDKKQSQENINGAQAQLQKMLGVEHSSQEELNKLVAERVELLKETARADFHARKMVESSETLRGVGNKSYDGQLVKDMAPDWAMARGDMVKEEKFKAKYKVKMSDGIGWENGLQNDLNSYLEQSKILKHSTAELEKSTVAANKILDTTTPPGGGDNPPDEKKSVLQKAEEKYAQSIRELDAKAEIEKLSKNEYNKALDDLNVSMLIDAKGSGDKEVLESKYVKDLQEAVAHPKYSKALGELEKVEKDYSEKLKELSAQKASGVISDKEYRDEMNKLSLETAKAAGSISGIGESGKGFVLAMQFTASTMKPDMPKMESRDKTFDYKKSDADIAGEELDVAKRNLEKLKETAKGNVSSFAAELNAAMQNVTNLEDALEIAVVMEDVKQLKQDLNEGIYSGIKESMSAIDGLVSSFQNLKEAFDPDSEASGWEKLMAVWSALTNAVDSFVSICKMVESLTELTNRLGQAQQAEATINTAVTATKVANAATGATADIGAATVKKATATANVTASTAEGAADAGKGAAKLPFPWNIVAIGGAIAAAIAAFALIPKFATGGIVGGNSPSGDKILARLNSGELILNKGQQSRLSDAIDSQRAGSNGGGVVVSGTSRVKGDDIYLSLSNHVKRTGKKSPWK